MPGLCRGESCGFKPWTALEGCILSFVLLRSVEISCFRREKIKKYLLKHQEKLCSVTSRMSLARDGFLFDFHYLNSPPT